MLTARNAAEPVGQLLTKFKRKPNDWENYFIPKAEDLTPDSSAALIVTTTEKFFVLFSKNFIQSLENIIVEVEAWYPCNVKKYIEPKVREIFSETEGSEYYKKVKPSEVAEWMPSAISDGHNYVFLLEIVPTNDNNSYWAKSRRIKEIGPDLTGQSLEV